MAVIQDPFHGLMDGILQGHAIAQQLHQQSLQDELFERRKQQDAREAQLQDLDTQMKFSQYGRPVTPGSNAVEQSTSGTLPGVVPGLPGQTYGTNYVRPVDKSRLLKAKLSDGREIQTEAYTPEEFQKRATDTAMAGKVGEFSLQQQMGDAVRQHQLQINGQPAPNELIRRGLAKPGEMMLPDEILKMMAQVATLEKPETKDVAEGASLVQLPRQSLFNLNTPGGSQEPLQRDELGVGTPWTPGTPQEAMGPTPGGNPLLVAAQPGQQARADFVNRAKAAGQPTVQPSAPSPGAPSPGTPTVLFAGKPKTTGDFQTVFLPAYAKKLGKTVDTLSPEETMAATTDYSRRSKNPTELAIEGARLALDRQRLGLERRNAGLDESGKPIQYADAAGNPINVSPLARQIAAYKMPPASARSYTNNRGLMNEVLAVNPNWDIVQYEQRHNTYNDLRPGGKLGQTNLALNTLVRHSDDMLNAIEALGNGSFTPANAGWQKFKQIFGSSAPTTFDALKNYVVGETVKLVRGGGGTEKDEERVAAVLNRAGSPQQLADAMKTNFEVAGGKMQAQNESIRKAINDQTYTALDPGAKEIMVRRGYDPETFKPARTPTGTLPQGGGKAADESTIKQFLDASGGDKEKARKSLTDAGWVIPKAK